MSIIKLNPEYQEKLISIGETLLTPEAKYGAFPFEIGSNKLTIYGHPFSIKAKTSLLDALPPEEFSKTPRLVTTIELTDINLPGFMLVWLYLNGIIENDTIVQYPSNYNILDYLIIFEWLDYFDIDETNEFTHILQKASETSPVSPHLDEAKKLFTTRVSKKKFVPDEAFIIFDVSPEEFKNLGYDIHQFDYDMWAGGRVYDLFVKELPKPLSSAQKEWLHYFVNLLIPMTMNEEAEFKYLLK